MLLISQRVLWSFSMLAVLGLGGAGCGGDDSSPNTSAGGGSNGTGGSNAAGGSSAAAADKFVGTWAYTSGSDNATCLGQMLMQARTGTATITKTSATTIVVVSGPCTLTFDVSGNTATAQAGQTCPFSQSGVSGTGTISSFTLTASADGKTAHLAGMSSVSAMVVGMNVTCSVTTTADLQKQ